MAEPDTTSRWYAATPPGVRPWLPTVILGLVALTGCAWTVIAGHAWLSLLAGCSRWLVGGRGEPVEVLDVRGPPQDQTPAHGAQVVPRVTPTPRAAVPSHSSAAGPTPGVSHVSSWPEPLQYDGATCAGVFVYAVTLSEQAPRLSAVSLATSSAAPGKYARPGQRVGDWEVLSITDDWTGANPVVWLARDEQVCRARLTGNPARAEAIQLAAVRRAAQLRQEARRRREERRRRRARRRR